MQEALLEVHRNEGHDCPRREWTDSYDLVAYELAHLGSHTETGHLFAATLAAFNLEPKEQLTVLRRLRRAFRDPALAAHLWPDPSAPSPAE